jgi:hypothetical protein
LGGSSAKTSAAAGRRSRARERPGRTLGGDPGTLAPVARPAGRSRAADADPSVGPLVMPAGAMAPVEAGTVSPARLTGRALCGLYAARFAWRHPLAPCMGTSGARGRLSRPMRWSSCVNHRGRRDGAGSAGAVRDRRWPRARSERLSTGRTSPCWTTPTPRAGSRSSRCRGRSSARRSYGSGDGRSVRRVW